MTQSLLIYGGSFDPIHQGHLQVALAVQREFQFKAFFFLPCKSPLLKDKTKASAAHRLAMLRIALTPYPDFQIDTRELDRETPSYMVETLQSLRKQHGSQPPLTLLLGEDAFSNLPAWHEWEKIITLAHILVITRKNTPNTPISPLLTTFLKTHQTHQKSNLLTQPFGKIYSFNAGDHAISSSEIRKKIVNNQWVGGVNEGVREYILRNRLYV